MTRIALLLLAWLSLAIGTVGIFLPLVPTVPLWLLSAWCFSKSSKRWHDWLMSHPRFGPVISEWQSGRGIPIKTKRRAIIFIWISMALSMLIIAKLWACLMLSAIGLGVSVYLWRLPTAGCPIKNATDNRKLPLV